MSKKKVAWAVLRGLQKPNGGYTLRQELARGLQALNQPEATVGTYTLEIGSTRMKDSELDRLPSSAELEKAWNIAAEDRLANLEVTIFEDRQEKEQLLAELEAVKKETEEVRATSEKMAKTLRE